jgi:hypothetical protein
MSRGRAGRWIRGGAAIAAGMAGTLAAAGVLIVANFHLAALAAGFWRTSLLVTEFLAGAPLLVGSAWLVLRLAVKLVEGE